MAAPYPEGMSAIEALGAHMRDRFEEKGARHGLAYPWWIAVIGGGGQFLCVLVAVGQRGLFTPPEPATLALVLAAVPQLAAVRRRALGALVGGRRLMLTAVGWLMTIPSTRGPGEPGSRGGDLHGRLVTATDGARPGLIAMVASCVVVAWSATASATRTRASTSTSSRSSAASWSATCCAGRCGRSPPSAASASRERERATLAERQRIAREIHDLVAHSLSVTMLHVTGARQALVAGRRRRRRRGGARSSDAEQVGRQAMAEIRRTVSVLATEPTGAHPLPCAEDIAALVAQVRDAGLPVDYASRGDLDRLSPAIGLGMYRIAPGVADERRQARAGRAPRR